MGNSGSASAHEAGAPGQGASVGPVAVPSAEGIPAELLPLFLKLRGRRVLVVGGGPVATAKTQSLVATGARVDVVAPELTPALAALCAAHDYPVFRRPFEPADVEGAWLVIAAAPPAINRAVSEAADAQQTFVVAVDDPTSATAYGGGVVRRAGVTFAIST
jgi:siroheme synthase-like protein